MEESPNMFLVDLLEEIPQKRTKPKLVELLC